MDLPDKNEDRWAYDSLDAGEVRDQAAIARREGITRAPVSQVMRFHLFPREAQAYILVKLLLDHGSDVNARISPSIVEFQRFAGDASLHRAAFHREVKITEILLSHGADVNAKNAKGITPPGLHPLKETGDNTTPRETNRRNVAGASRIAVGGYDPIAFFTDGKPTPGDPVVTSLVGDWTDRALQFRGFGNIGILKRQILPGQAC